MSGKVSVKGVELLNTGLTFCNYFHIATNFIILFVCVISIIYSIYVMSSYNTTEGIVISIEDSEYGRCLSEPRRDSKRINSSCELGVSYSVNNEELESYFDYVGYSGDYEIGDMIRIMYNKDNYYDIMKNSSSALLFVMAVIVLLLTILGTYLRLYHSDKSLIQFWIGMTCFKTFFSNR